MFLQSVYSLNLKGFCKHLFCVTIKQNQLLCDVICYNTIKSFTFEYFTFDINKDLTRHVKQIENIYYCFNVIFTILRMFPLKYCQTCECVIDSCSRVSTLNVSVHGRFLFSFGIHHLFQILTDDIIELSIKPTYIKDHNSDLRINRFILLVY